MALQKPLTEEELQAQLGASQADEAEGCCVVFCKLVALVPVGSIIGLACVTTGCSMIWDNASHVFDVFEPFRRGATADNGMLNMLNWATSVAFVVAFLVCVRGFSERLRDLMDSCGGGDACAGLWGSADGKLCVSKLVAFVFGHVMDLLTWAMMTLTVVACIVAAFFKCALSFLVGACETCDFEVYSDDSDDGEALCEGHGYGKRQCANIGCCEYYRGDCLSAVGQGVCKQDVPTPSPTGAGDVSESTSTCRAVIAGMFEAFDRTPLDMDVSIGAGDVGSACVTVSELTDDGVGDVLLVGAAVAAFGAMFTLAYWMKYSVWYKVLELKEEKARGQFRPGAELRGDVVLM